MANRRTYKILFQNQGKLYEIYARSVQQSGLYGFIEVEKLLFGEKSSVVLDPSEEHLKAEFQGVARTHLPLYSIVRIDEVEKEGHGRIIPLEGQGSKVMPFPVVTQGETKK